jgi:hypothetical protein
LQAVVAAAAVGTADFDAVHSGDHQPSGPIGAQDAVAFETASDFTAEIEEGFGRLPLHGIAEGVVADRPNALGQRPGAALVLDLEQAGPLHGRPQKDGVEDLRPGVLRKLSSLRQRAHPTGEVEHLVEISFEAVTIGQT